MRWTTVGLLLMVVGSAIIGLPDPNNRLFSFSEDHGPAPLDALGLFVLLAGYMLLASVVWRRRRRLSRSIALAALAAFVAGAALLVPAVAYDRGALWAVAVAVMALPQAYLLIQALRRSRARERAG